MNVPRSIGVIGPTGGVETEALSTSLALGDSFNIFTGIYSPDGNQFYMSSGDAGFGPSGIFYFPSITQSATPQGSIAGNEIASTGSLSYLGLESYAGIMLTF